MIMSRIIEMRMDDQTTFFAEVEEGVETPPAARAGKRRDGLFLASPQDEVPQRVATSVTNALDAMKPMLGKVKETLHAMGPEEYQVEFGLKLNGEVGIFVSKGGAEAHIKVTMKWKKQTTSSGGASA